MKQIYTFFKNIKSARLRAGLSQRDLASKLEISNKTVSAYETGRAIPPAPTLAKLAEITKTPLSQLIGISGEMGESEITKRLKNIEFQITKQSQTDPIPRTKIDVFVGIVLTDNKKRIYLIKEDDKYDIALGRWNLPGGSVDGNENLIDSVIREAQEETGYSVKVDSLIGCYKCKKGKNSWIYTVFKANLVGKYKEKTDPGVKEGKWFTKKEFLNLHPSRIVHHDMKLVYKIATENRGLATESIKYIDYDKEQN